MDSDRAKDTGREEDMGADAANPVMQGLSDTAQTLGASVQAMQQVLLGNMQQAAQMTLSMNQMMEELVKRAVHVSVISQPSHQTGSCSLVLRITNRSPIPLSRLTTKLWFARHRGGRQDTGSLAARCTDEAVQSSLFGGFAEEKRAVLDTEASGESPFISGSRLEALASGDFAESTVRVECEWPAQIAGKIAVEFASPGTGNALAVSHRFGVHVRQLMPCSFEEPRGSSSSSGGGGAEQQGARPVDGSESVSIGIEEARSIFRVPPTSGVGVGALFKMGSDSEYLALRVESISEDSGTARCVWLRSDNDNDNDSARLCSLIPLLSKELSLCK